MIKFKKDYIINLFKETSFYSGDFMFRKGFYYDYKVMNDTYFVWYGDVRVELTKEEAEEYLEV